MPDIIHSEHHEAIINNSDTMFFLSHEGKESNLEKYRSELSLTSRDLEIILSMKKSDHAICIRQGTHTTEYIVQLSQEELALYTTSKEHKATIKKYIDQYNGNVQMAIKKILIIILAGVLLHPLPTNAQFGQDAAALIGFLTPYLGALEALSEASGMEISDLKKITQQSIQLTSSLAKVYNAGNRLYRVSSRTHEIYIEYLETIKYIYDNSIYFEDEEASYHVAVLNKVVFGQADQDGKLSVNNIMDGAMGDLKDLLNSMQSGAQTTLTEMARYLDDVRKQMDDTYGIICSYHTYLICSVNRKQHELGMYELDEYLTNRKK